MLNIRQQKISGDNVYEFLLLFDKLYDRFTDAEKKGFLKSFVEQVDLYEEEQPDTTSASEYNPYALMTEGEENGKVQYHQRNADSGSEGIL